MGKLKILYYLDVRIVRLRKVVKHFLPVRLVSMLRKDKNRSTSGQFGLIDTAFPWMSPNIWREIISFYSKLDEYTVVEFGTGASTLNHIQQMMAFGRSNYIGIENNPAWFWLVFASIVRMANHNGSKVEVDFNYHRGEVGSEDIDAEISFDSVTISLRLRTNTDDYISAFNQTCDVVIVDGIARKECIRKVLSSPYLREGGMLMLMEAGRGSSDWWEGRLYGDDDYSLELNALLSLGGVLIDGDGVDNWPGCTRKSPRPTSYYYPMEACKLIMPNTKKENSDNKI